MQKVLKTAALIAALAAVSCSNAALREGSASQAARGYRWENPRVRGIGPAAKDGGTVRIETRNQSYDATEHLIFDCVKDPAVYADALLRAAGVTDVEQFVYYFKAFTQTGYRIAGSKGDNGVLFFWNITVPTETYTYILRQLILSPKYYKLALDPVLRVPGA